MSAQGPSSPSRREVLQAALAASATAAGAFASVRPAMAIAAAPLTGSATALAAGAVEGAGAVPDAKQFLTTYQTEFQKLYTAAAGAQWIASTDVKDEHTHAAVTAQQALDRFIGAPDRMAAIRALREDAWRHDELTNRQLFKAWMAAAHAPGNIPDLVKARTEAEAAQNQTQNGFTYEMTTAGGEKKKVGANDIDDILIKSSNLDERRAAWEASKEIGKACRPGLIKLRELRNQVGRGLGFSSFFGLEVADYGMPVSELMSLMKTVIEQTRPMFEQLHCYTKHILAKRYGQPVPRRIPAHWLGNRWGQEWPGIVAGVDLDPLFKDKTPEWIIQQAERFYVSMGMPTLPKSFWEKSDLYDLPADAPRKKNRHASAWHVDLDHDVRSLMSVKSDANWFSTTHHELGHIYYYLAYTDAGVPLMLREGANRAFHEGIGDLITLASKQKPYLAEIGLLKPGAGGDDTQWLLSQALDGNIVLMPWACGTMTHFEHALYEEELPAGKLNAKWWEYVQTLQGIDPPAGARGEEYCDAASKTHINDDPAQYYDYAMGTLIVYQVHDYIARKILKQDPRNCNYYGRKDVGEYLSSLLKLGATRDWRQVIQDYTGEPLSARAMLDYYAPLMEFLKKENAGRDVGFA